MMTSGLSFYEKTLRKNDRYFIKDRGRYDINFISIRGFLMFGVATSMKMTSLDSLKTPLIGIGHKKTLKLQKSPENAKNKSCVIRFERKITVIL